MVPFWNIVKEQILLVSGIGRVKKVKTSKNYRLPLHSTCKKPNQISLDCIRIIFYYLAENLKSTLTMPYEPLHHKYRPQTFKDLVGQETIALTLSNALRQEKIAPAYLFTGPRGTGKTSSARILAKSLNCLTSDRPTPEPCGKCEACLAIAKGSALDVMEIDAASNTGVDNIREIIERSRFAPVQCRYKIYAIDECHMLSTAAFNALLKTLEEPPPRVVFILATTDPQRVLSTIISRCQRFDYRRIPLTEMTAHLKYIADAEQIAIADDALTLIAQIANGGLRDAESLLDQLSLLPEAISVAKVWDLVGAVPEQDLLKLLQAINCDDSLTVLEQCRSLLDRGREPLIVLQNLASFYLNLLIAKTAPQRPDLIAVTETCWQHLCTEAANWDTGSILRGQQQLKEAETQLKQTTQPRLWLEVTLLGLLPQANMAIDLPDTATNNSIPRTSDRSSEVVFDHRPDPDVPPPASKTPVAPQPSKPIQPEEDRQTKPDSSPEESRVSSSSQTTTPALASPQESVKTVAEAKQDSFNTQEIWSKIVSCLQPPTTQALLKQQCHLVSFDGSSAIVGISSAKLQKLNQGKVPNIEAAFAKVCQRKVKVQLEVAVKNASLKNSFPENSESSETSPLPQTSLSQPISTPSPQLGVTVEKETLRPPATPQTVETKPDPSETYLANKDRDPQSVVPQLDSGRQNDSITTANPIPKNAIAPPPAIADSDLNSDYADDLQQAIDNLTQSFEGELVQFDNPSDSFTSDVVEPSESSLSLERPDVENYDDEW